MVAWFAEDPADAEHYARESSRTTHAAQECIDGCELLARLLLQGYAGKPVTLPIDPGNDW